jgi:hypothetical protein
MDIDSDIAQPSFAPAGRRLNVDRAAAIGLGADLQRRLAVLADADLSDSGMGAQLDVRSRLRCDQCE